MPSTASTSKGPQSSGIETSASGDRHIPESVRADGSIRKEIKIRPGYRPPEDVAVYKNRTAEAWKNRGTGPVPGYEGLKAAKKEADGKDGEGQADGQANNKNAKRREARKKAKVANAAGEETAEGVDGAANVNTFAGPAAATTQHAETAVDPEAEKEKQARTLKKKLRQARDLKEKKDSGESLLPEQLAKVIKIQELIRQLDSLGFDVDGEKKP